MELSVVPLHKHPEYIISCCHLINDEWKRSDTARIRSLECSRDQLPTSLILLQNKELIGHLKLSPIPSILDSCFVESVVINGKLRGKGFGTMLMTKTEEYCKDFLHLNTVYLSTMGQEQFYSKLGYTECLPVSIYGNYIPNSTTAPENVKKYQKETIAEKSSESTKEHFVKNVPPPPPMLINTIPKSSKTFMKKCL